MPDICNTPILSVGCNAASSAASKAAGTAFDAAAQRIAEGFAKATEITLTFWTDVDMPTLDQNHGAVASLRVHTAWFAAAVAVASLIIAGIKMALSMNARPARDALRGVFTFVLVAGAGVAAINALGHGTDLFSKWIIDDAADGQLGERIALMAGITSASSPNGLGAGLVLLVGFVGILASLGQMLLMMVRVGMVTIIAGILPLAAAGTGTEQGRAWFNRLVSWVVAYLLYKPAAAIVYAGAFYMLGDANDPRSILIGLFMLILSILALPALLRLVTPVVGAAMSGGGGGAAAAAGMAVASGARMAASGSGGGAARSTGGGGGAHQAGLTPQGPQGAGQGAPSVPMTRPGGSSADVAKSAATSAAPMTGGASLVVAGAVEAAQHAQKAASGAAESQAGQGT